MKQLVLAISMFFILSASAALAQVLPDRALSVQGGAADVSADGRPKSDLRPAVATLLSLFDRDIVEGLREAWRRATGGAALIEAVVLIIRQPDGSCKAILPASTNEYRRFTFHWQPGTVAVLHTHPNTSDPRPSPADKDIAEHYHVLMFTLARRGMFLYDPATRAISKVRDGVEWLEYSKWARYAPALAAKPTARP